MMKIIAKTLIFTVIAPCTVTVWIPYLLLSSGLELYICRIGPLRFIGLVPMTIGAFFYFRCARDFAFTGKGTPAPIDPPKALVTKGLYRIVRNPMYVGGVLILSGESLLFESLLFLAYTMMVWLIFHLFVVFYEEPTLRQKFGAAYDEYRAVTPRWIPDMKQAKKNNGGRNAEEQERNQR